MASILVVDDRPGNLDLVGRHLEEANHEVQLVSGAETAIERIDKGDFYDLVILDDVLSSTSGYDLCQRIRRREHTQEAPILFLTEKRGGLPDPLRGSASSVDDYLLKPVDRRELLSRVEVMLRLKAALEEAQRTNERLAILVEERTRVLSGTVEALERERRLWEGMVRRLRSAVIVCDEHQRLTTASDVAVDLLGEIPAGQSLSVSCLAPFFEPEVQERLARSGRVSRWIETRKQGQRRLEAELSDLASDRPQRLMQFVDVTDREARIQQPTDRELSELREEVRALRRLQGHYRMTSLVGVSPGVARIHRVVNQLRHSPATVLIQGESGTGKELVARAVHFDGQSRHRPFVPVDCGAIPSSLAESVLFGHVKGAITGADQESPGLFREAEEGTLFLDDVCQCSSEVQAQLLRALQSREIRPVGSGRVCRVKTRVIAATKRPLARLVEAGRFREDLYHRLAVVQIDIPPLRERPEDIPVLAAHFLAAEAARSGRIRPPTGISNEAMRALEAHAWEGNVRELRNVLVRAVALATGPLVQLEDLPRQIRGRCAEHVRFTEVNEGPAEGGYLLPRRVRLAEREMILDALQRSGWNKVRAAKMLGIGKSSLYRKIKELKIGGP